MYQYGLLVQLVSAYRVCLAITGLAVKVVTGLTRDRSEHLCSFMKTVSVAIYLRKKCVCVERERESSTQLNFTVTHMQP